MQEGGVERCQAVGHRAGIFPHLASRNAKSVISSRRRELCQRSGAVARLSARGGVRAWRWGAGASPEQAAVAALERGGRGGDQLVGGVGVAGEVGPADGHVEAAAVVSGADQPPADHVGDGAGDRGGAGRGRLGRHHREAQAAEVRGAVLDADAAEHAARDRGHEPLLLAGLELLGESCR